MFLFIYRARLPLIIIREKGVSLSRREIQVQIRGAWPCVNTLKHIPRDAQVIIR